MARAKDTTRSEARRRTREQMRADFTTETGEEPIDDAVPAPDAPREPRRTMFKMPDVRADLRALPGMFRTRRLLWVPLILLLVGFGLLLALPGLSVDMANIALLFLQFFFVPPALFTFFIAGFLAPRGSYLVGLIYGLIAGLLWAVGFVYWNMGITTGGTSAPAPSVAPIEVFGQMLMIGALYGTLAAAFAAWYRDFLRQMQDRGKQRRAEQETKLRAQRRQERQETRRPAKKPTT